jgi:hypothetical protein
MRCHRCDGDLLQVASLDNRNQSGELLYRYICKGCLQIYEAWYRPVTFYAIAIEGNDEQEALLVRLCSACGGLYPDGEAHRCTEDPGS